MATTETIARYSREHNGANVLTLGATLVSAGRGARDRDDVADDADAEPRYIRRLAKIRDAGDRRLRSEAVTHDETSCSELIDAIVSELTPAPARAAAGALRVPRGARRLLSGSAARRARRRRDAASACTPAAARRPASRR